MLTLDDDRHHGLSRGAFVTIIDDLSTGKWENLQAFKASSRLKVLIASAADAALLERWLQQS